MLDHPWSEGGPLRWPPLRKFSGSVHGELDPNYTVPASIFETEVIKMSLVVRKPVFDVSDQARHNKIARGFKFRISEVYGLYYPCSENKGADQLHSYYAADLHLCFCTCKKSFFFITRLK